MGKHMKSISKNRQRTFWASAIFVLLIGVGAQSVWAEDSGKAIEDGAKATEKGFGNLLKGMGQEIGKVIEPTDEAKKNSDKKDAKPADGSKSAEEKKP